MLHNANQMRHWNAHNRSRWRIKCAHLRMALYSSKTHFVPHNKALRQITRSCKTQWYRTFTKFRQAWIIPDRDKSRHSGSEHPRRRTINRFCGTVISSHFVCKTVFMRQQNILGANTSREPVPKMAAIVPPVQSSPKSNGNTTDSSELVDATKTNKVVRDSTEALFSGFIATTFYLLHSSIVDEALRKHLISAQAVSFTMYKTKLQELLLFTLIRYQ